MVHISIFFNLEWISYEFLEIKQYFII